tara:strand:- start:443 stop:2146 length:1704 start_codon:yes stop_codon:yes gene_type:complete
MSASSQFTDSCSDDADNDIGNYCTWNAICAFPSAKVTLGDGNTKATITPDGAIIGNQFFDVTDSDGFYWETKFISNVSNAEHVGIGQQTVPLNNTSYLNNGIATYLSDGGADHTSSDRYSGGTFPTYTDGDTISVAVKGGAIWFAKNNTWINGASAAEIAAGTTTNAVFTGLTGMWTPMVRGHSGSATVSTTNWGASAFAYTPPTGLKRLMTADRSAPTVTKPDDFFNTLLYTGNGGTLAVTGAGFQPDFVWLKCRSVATNWNVVDVVRGADAMLRMASSTNTEQSGANQEFESFDSDGFTVIHHGGVVEELNRSGATYVGYCMKAGGSPSSNVQGNVTSSVSAASHGGFSIGTFTTGTTGAITIGHGLSRAPGMIIVKDRVSTGQYWTFLESQGAGKYLTLNTTDAPASSTAVWNNTAPTATVFSTQDNGAWLTANNSHVFYAFAKTPGLIGMGTYTGNGSADGAFIQVDDGASGFKPAWVMVKRLEAGYAWHIQDAVRSPYNPTALGLNANDTGTDSASTAYDFIANGFKLRTTDGGYNGSASYMYLAFAEDPFGGDGVAQARAR